MRCRAAAPATVPRESAAGRSVAPMHPGPAMAALPLLAMLLLGAAPASGASEPRGGIRADPAALEAARRFLCPHGGGPVRGLRGRCRGGAGAKAGSVRGWDEGLPPPLRSQLPCPEGTVAALALARPEATRCMPR